MHYCLCILCMRKRYLPLHPFVMKVESNLQQHYSPLDRPSSGQRRDERRNDLGGASRRPGAQYRRAPSTGDRRRRSRSRSLGDGLGDGPGDSQHDNVRNSALYSPNLFGGVNCRCLCQSSRVHCNIRFGGKWNGGYPHGESGSTGD